jgi:uncharacterized pyridoxamine 5'-phosphate oxidase family protein
MSHSSHEQRVKRELKAVGLSVLAQHKSEGRHVAELIHDDEHIKGAIYGQYDDGSAMLVATDKRVIFFDKKPLFRTVDELTYDVISGVRVIKQGLFSGVVLHTRVGDYALRYVNPKSIIFFKKYLQSHLLEHPTRTHKSTTGSQQKIELDADGLAFLKNNELATLSSLDRTGNVNGAVVYYYVHNDGSIYILTKLATQKARNVYAHPKVALTIYDAEKLQTLQLEGIVELETNLQMRKFVFEKIAKPRQYGEEKRLPPVVQLMGQDFIVLRVSPTTAKFTDFKKLP